MNGVREVVTHAVIAIVVASVLVEFAFAIRYRGRVLARLGRPNGRVRFYRRVIGLGVMMVALVVVTTLASEDLSAADVGWTWPRAEGDDYALAALLMVLLVAGSLRARRALRRGRMIPGLAAISPLIPRTATERRLAAGVAFSTGVSEELLFRGLLLGAATELYHLPLIAAVVACLALFVALHTYQGYRGMAGSAALGLGFTGAYLVSGSVLLPIVMHVVNNLVGLLLVPARPTVPAAAGRPAEPARTEPTSAPPAPATPATPPTLRSPAPPG